MRPGTGAGPWSPGRRAPRRRTDRGGSTPRFSRCQRRDRSGQPHEHQRAAGCTGELGAASAGTSRHRTPWRVLSWERIAAPRRRSATSARLYILALDVRGLLHLGAPHLSDRADLASPARQSGDLSDHRRCGGRATVGGRHRSRTRYGGRNRCAVLVAWLIADKIVSIPTALRADPRCGRGYRCRHRRSHREGQDQLVHRNPRHELDPPRADRLDLGQRAHRGGDHGFQTIATGQLFGVVYPVYLRGGGLGLAVWYVLEHTSFGRRVYATGANPEALAARWGPHCSR